MVTYVIDQTDSNKPSINVEEKTIDRQLPIALFGRERLEYGELMNENILHLLENFACPQGSDGNPDLSGYPEGETHPLNNPQEGQLWYNSGYADATESATEALLHVYKVIDDAGSWVPLSMFSEIAANSGTIAHGEQIPKPVSSTGATFEWDECSWMVSPSNYEDDVEFMICSTEGDAVVRMQYRPVGGTMVDGVANYMIIGIRGNNNQGFNEILPPAITPTTTPNPTMTPTPTFGVTATVTPTVTVTPSVTPTNSPIPATPPVSPPNSVEPFGENARLFGYPSPGYTASVSPTSVSYHKHSCGDLVWDEQDPATVVQFRHLYFSRALERSTRISLVGLSGGVPPYTVDFGNVNYTGSDLTTTHMQWAGDPNLYPLPAEPTLLDYYGGGQRQSSSANEIRINVDPDETAYISLNTYVGNTSAWPDLDAASYLNWFTKAWGYVRATDSVGQSISWWITEDCTQASGSNQRTNPGSVYYFGEDDIWNHYYDCSICPGTCIEEMRIIGYP